MISSNILNDSGIFFSKNCGKKYFFDEFKSLINFNKKVIDSSSNDGCYIATSVYGSYDCPEVWNLRCFRDIKCFQKAYLEKYSLSFIVQLI